jgi:hypothetical protein
MPEASIERAATARKLSPEQRKTVLKWMAAGDDDYQTIRHLLKKHSFPMLSRKTVYYYRKQLGRERCAACGQTLPQQI